MQLSSIPRQSWGVLVYESIKTTPLLSGRRFGGYSLPTSYSSLSFLDDECTRVELAPLITVQLDVRGVDVECEFARAIRMRGR